MTQAEWADIAKRIIAKWPHQQPSVGSLAESFNALKDLDPSQVMAAVESFYREGKEWPPTGGMLRKRVFELAVDAPAFGDAWAAILYAVRKYGYPDRTGAMRWLEEAHPLYPKLVAQMGWREICLSENVDVIRGQARRIFEKVVEQTTRDLTLRGLPDAGLSTLERINSPEYRELVARTMREMPQIGRAV